VEAGPWVELRVSDTGPGIPAELLDRIFDPFFSTKMPGQGSGMGLAMVHGIVHDHDGHVLVETEPGQGATFTILLPSVAPADRSATGLRVHAAEGEQLPQADVLLVEDDPSVGDYLQEQLSNWGLRVTLLRDPVAALRWLAAPPVDVQLLLTDLTMPGMTGLQLAREVRRLHPELPVLLVTGNAAHFGSEELEANGVTLALKKPVDPAVLRTAAAGAPALRLRQGHTRAAAASASSRSIAQKVLSRPVWCASHPPSQIPTEEPTWCTSITMPNSVPSRAVPKRCATSEEVGGSVAMWLAPMTTAKASRPPIVGGTSTKARMPSARTT